MGHQLERGANLKANKKRAILQHFHSICCLVQRDSVTSTSVKVFDVAHNSCQRRNIIRRAARE